MSTAASYHNTRFAHDARREVAWRTLIRYHFSRYIGPEDTVVELGCGYGHFINNVRARRRIAMDIWPDFPSYLSPGVEARVASATELDFLPDGSVDFVLASNLFEHLSQADLLLVLARLKSKLSPRGMIAILQPNYRYAYREYFDDYTHVSVYSHLTMRDILEGSGYTVLSCKPRFLPLSVKGSRAVWPWLIRLYLLSPWKPLGKQMLFLARPDDSRLLPRP